MRLLVPCLLLVTALGTTAPALAQCPDGAPPPCTAAPPVGSVAVLYFDNRGTDSADAYLAQGLTDEIITRLEQVRRLTIASRYASQRVRNRHATPAALGRELRVRFLVGGSVQRIGGRLVVRAELMRADRERGVWAERYDRRGDDLLTLVDEIAQAVAVGVTGELLPPERASLTRAPTRNSEAFRLFVLANWRFARRTQIDVRRAVEAYTAAPRCPGARVCRTIPCDGSGWPRPSVRWPWIRNRRTPGRRPRTANSSKATTPVPAPRTSGHSDWIR